MTVPAARRRLLLRDLASWREAFSAITPNWFASVMGTGIVAVALAGLPVDLPGARLVALVFWVLAGVVLVVVTAATAVHWALFPDVARSHHRNPVMAHFYGAPPMALLTVGAGALLVGRDVLGLPTALAVDVVLWVAGTALGLGSAVLLPYLAFTRLELPLDRAFGGWLMPVVPPMVSASTGALLVPHVPAGPSRETLVISCYGLVGLSLFASIFVIAQIWAGFTQHDIGLPGTVPTVWIVLGPLGQSVTAVGSLGSVASQAVPEWGRAFAALGALYGVPVLGFAGLWAAIAVALTARALHRGMPFSLTWWSFTFPVGTCATGAAALARQLGLDVYRGLAVVAVLGLLIAWTVVAARTIHGALVRGHLLLAPVRVAASTHDGPDLP